MSLPEAILRLIGPPVLILGGLAFLGANPTLVAAIPFVLIGSLLACGLLLLIVGIPFAIIGAIVGGKPEVEVEEDPKSERIAQLERRKRTLNKLRAEDKITKEQWLQETKRAQDLIDALA